MSDADHFVFLRHLESQVVERLLTKSIQIWIPRRARRNIVTSFAGFFEHLVARVLYIDRLLLAERRSFWKYDVERAVFLAALLHKMNILTLVIGNPRHSQIRQQSKLHHPFSRDQRLESDCRPAE